MYFTAITGIFFYIRPAITLMAIREISIRRFVIQVAGGRQRRGWENVPSLTMRSSLGGHVLRRKGASFHLIAIDPYEPRKG